MTKYVKLISEVQIKYAPANKGNIINYNCNVEEMAKDGYYEFIQIDKPETQRRYEIHYADIGQKITEVIYYLETEEETQTRLLTEAKDKKYQENEAKRDEFMVAPIIYNGIEFDCDMEQAQNLDFQERHMTDDETVDWLAYDGVTVLKCTKTDIQNLGMLIVAKRQYVWTVKNPQIKLAIQNAQTVEEVEAIEINYDFNEVLGQQNEN